MKTSGQSNNINQGLSEDSEEILLKSFEESSKDNLLGLLSKLLNNYKDPDRFIKGYQSNKRRGHPSDKRWLWQAIIVFCGAAISLYLICGLIDALIGIFLGVILWRIIIYIFSYTSHP